jgi:hypothetical protein
MKNKEREPFPLVEEKERRRVHSEDKTSEVSFRE